MVHEWQLLKLKVLETIGRWKDYLWVEAGICQCRLVGPPSLVLLLAMFEYFWSEFDSLFCQRPTTFDCRVAGLFMFPY